MSNAILRQGLSAALLVGVSGLSIAAQSPIAAKPAPAVTHSAAPVLPALTAAQIVEKNVAARGGLTAWRAVQSLSWKGTMGAGGTNYATINAKGQLKTGEREEVRLPFRMELKRPLKSRLELDFNGATAVQIFDGAKGWKLRPFLGRTSWDAYSADELKQAAAEPGIDGMLIDYAAKGTRVDLAGTDKVEGHAAYKLKVTRKDGQVRQVWIDGQSFLDIKVDGDPRRFDGKMRKVVVLMRDFKAEQGLMIPRVQETAVEGVAKTEKIQIEGVTVNPRLDDTRFAPSK
jgi:outer membrane lipoprotein-sorting protein